VAPALVAQEILGKQLDQGRKRKKTGRNGVHDPDNNEPNFRVGAVERMGGKTDCLADWCSIFPLVLRRGNDGAGSTRVKPYANAISQGCHVLSPHSMTEILEPSARPSNVSATDCQHAVRVMERDGTTYDGK
jgi:hypothetical protein